MSESKPKENPADNPDEYRLNRALKDLRHTVRESLDGKFICDLLNAYPGNNPQMKYSAEDTDIERDKYINEKIDFHIAASNLTEGELLRLSRICERSTHSKVHAGNFNFYFPEMVGMASSVLLLFLGLKHAFEMGEAYEISSLLVGILGGAISIVSYRSKKERAKAFSEIEIDKLLAAALKDKVDENGQ
jgi:hypothetical protein